MKPIDERDLVKVDEALLLLGSDSETEHQPDVRAATRVEARRLWVQAQQQLREECHSPAKVLRAVRRVNALILLSAVVVLTFAWPRGGVAFDGFDGVGPQHLLVLVAIAGVGVLLVRQLQSWSDVEA